MSSLCGWPGLKCDAPNTDCPWWQGTFCELDIHEPSLFGKFRVIIAGGRDFNNYISLKETLDKLLENIHQEIIIVCGMARGADTLGEQYAKEKGYKIDYYPADWKTYGKQAGYLRNEQMAQNADALVAFWDGQSKGTKHMIDLAHKYNLKVRIKRYANE